MSIIHVKASRRIEAPADKVYAVLADYRVGHPAILPKPLFQGLTVTKGGYGAGTEITVEMSVFGQKQELHQVVTEPEPGRVLMEGSRDGSLQTHFIVEPLSEGACNVTITTDMRPSAGLLGWVERLVVPMLNPPAYKEELKNLEAYVQRTTQA